MDRLKSNLLDELMTLTEEEKEILEFKNNVMKDIYTSQTNFVIESEKFLSKDHMITLRKHTRFIDFPKHKHDYIEINYVYNGSFHQRIGNEEISLGKGEMVFLNQHIEHEIKACSEEDIIINFIIQPRFFEFIFSYLNSENMVSDFLINSLYSSTQKGQYLYFQVAHIDNIQDLMKKIIDEMMRPTLLSDSSIKLYMGLFIIELIKNSDKIVKKHTYSMQHYLIVEVLKYIEENYRNATLYEVSDRLNQTHYSLSKAIKKATSFTFKELLQERRLNKAKEFLENTTLPIAEIVDKVGYENISYFYRIFKKRYHLTPKAYRDQ